MLQLSSSRVENPRQARKLGIIAVVDFTLLTNQSFLAEALRPRYLLPHSFGQEVLVGEEGEVEDSDDPQLPGLPCIFDTATGELQHFLADLQGNVATDADFKSDAQNFEKNWARDVRFLHHHCHDHECASTCIKNQKKMTKEQQADQLKSNRARPCRFDFFHIVLLKILIDKLTKIRRRGKEIVNVPYIMNTTARNKFGEVALERPQPLSLIHI